MQACGNYRLIKLMAHRLVVRKSNGRVRSEVIIYNNKFGSFKENVL